MTWSRLLILWLLAIATGTSVGCALGANGSITYQANLPVGDVYVPLVVMSSLLTALVGAWVGFIAGLTAVATVAVLDRRLRLPARRRNVITALAAGAGGYGALSTFYSGPSALESPWTFVGLGFAIAATAFVAVSLCGRKARSADAAWSDSPRP